MRSDSLRVLVLALALPTAGSGDAMAQRPAGPAPALGFRGDARHTGVYGTAGPRELPVMRWRLMTDGPIRSSPLLVGSTIYVGSGDRFLRAVDVASGKERWRFETGGAVCSSPCCADGVVYVTSRDRCLYAVAADSGQLRWRFAMGDDLPFRWGYDYFLSSPLVVGEQVYVGGGDGYVYALAAKTGAEVWKCKTDGRVRSSPAYADEMVFVGSMDGYLYAVAAGTGKQIWKFESQGARDDPKKFPFDHRSLISSPAIADATIAIGGRDGFLYGVDAKTGKEHWRSDHRLSWVVSSPAIAQGLALAGTSDGKFFQAVDVGTGQERWRCATNSNVFGSGTVAGDVVYLGDMSGEFYALALQTGEKLWLLRLPGPTFATPAVADGALYIACDDGCLYAFERPALALQPRGPAKKAVYFDPQAKWKWFTGDQQVRNYFASKGYEVLGPDALAGFLEARAKDSVPSVVVLASDMMPKDFGSDVGMGKLKDYLTTGGKMVCLGVLPLYIDLDPSTGKPAFLRPRRAKKLLGVQQDERMGEQHGAVITSEGLRWGLRKWWVGMQGVEPADVTTVLATDEVGRAVAWVKVFKEGVPGAGFVRLWGRPEPYPNLDELQAIVEYGIH
jgi:outer membrane protein assembly factor BamB